MRPYQELGRTLLFLGVILIAGAAIFHFGSKFGFRLGHLPGDIVRRGEHGSFHFPLVSSIVISGAISLILWLINQFRR